MPSDISPSDLLTAVNLLRKYSSLEVVSRFLKNRLLPSSAGSWQEMRESRLEPALQAGKLTRADIVNLIREAEEFGKQHVFLYNCGPQTASEVLNPTTLEKRLKKMDLMDLKDKPVLIEETNGLRLVDIRIDSTSSPSSLVIKAVDSRTYKRLVSRVFKGTQEILTFEPEQDRAVNVISVRADGLTEVRIQSHHNTLNYGKQVEEMFAKSTGIIDQMSFPSFSLAKTRLYMLNNRKKLTRTVRFHDNVLRDKQGNAMSLASAGRQLNLYEEGSASDKGVAAFLSAGRTTCDEVDCSWLKLEDGSGPSTDIHTLIEGANNEFNVTARCSRADYSYVLGKITSFAR